ncbi:MAG: glycosyltransferase [Nitrospiraceae bacterium]|nr:glycosyltransferase [Nitrospiraceae bacterium]
MKISIVIPVYKSEKILPVIAKQIDEAMEEAGLSRDYEVILVNDCSPDESWQIIEKLCDCYPSFKGINLMKNTGQHNAIMAGLNHTNGRTIVMMDDDLQHSPKYIIQLFLKINEGFDVCYTKFKERKHSLWKVLGSAFNDKAATIMLGKPKKIYLSSFKAISSDVKNIIITYTGPFAYVDGLILMATNNLTSIEVEHYERHEGKGNYTFAKGIMLWMKMATIFSIVPLRIATFLGFISAIVGFILALILIIEKLTMNVPVRGWASLIVTVLIMGGIQLIALGAIGEYLGRIYININKKPQFVIKSKKNLS